LKPSEPARADVTHSNTTKTTLVSFIISSSN
jgi:hypothetical protein